MNFISVFAVLAALWTSCSSLIPEMNLVHTKFEFLQSFKGPRLADPRGNIPFWNHGGSAIPSEESVRVCPSIKSRRGWVWSKNPFSSSHWYIDVSIKVTGRLKSGADGMGIWVTDQPGTEGHVFGNTATWKGIGLFLDSFDNDEVNDNPKIQLVLNDGTVPYQHLTDGISQESGSCLKDFRNKPYPVKIRLVYLRGSLEVWVHEGVSLSDDDYELCLRVEPTPALAQIPKTVYFGVSAATGGLSDDHDVLSFLTYSVSTYEQKAVQNLLNNNTAFNELIQKYNLLSGEFDQRRDDYQQKHPDMYPQGSGTARDSRMDWQQEVKMDRSMKLVVDMQVALQKDIRLLNRKVDIVISGKSNTETESGPKGYSPNALYGLFSGELSQIKSVEGNILHQLADLRAVMDRSVPEGSRATASEQMQPVYEIRNQVGQQQQQLDAISTLIQELAKNKCPTPSLSSYSCLTTWMFVGVVIVQLLVLIGYSCYRDAQERSAKKFF